MNDKKNHSLSYEDAGVSIEQGNELVARIKQTTANTHRNGVMGSIGGFGALFDLSSLDYKQPVLVSGTDGVGTKIKLAIEHQRHESIGIDLVAMCVNDLIVQGAEPLFFLDYFASSKLDVEVAETVINGIAEGCQLAGCSLIGGETAEMPGMYADGDYDLAGFCVGAVEKDDIIDGAAVQEGDTLIALASSGCHSNGYSLIRKVLEVSEANPQSLLDGKPIVDILLEPTRIYVKSILQLVNQMPVNAISHITGGGLIENIPRVIPDSLSVELNRASWDFPAIFDWLKQQGHIDQEEMYRTFNCGVGMVICIASDHAEQALSLLSDCGEQAWVIGHVSDKCDHKVTFI